MRIALAIVSLFPGGGLQRDCIDIAQTLTRLGHDVTIFTSRVDNTTLPDDIPLVIYPNSATTNHQRQKKFAVDVLNNVPQQCDLLVGFDKLLGLDVLYCADASIYYRMIKRPYLFLRPRYLTFAALEKDSFARHRSTKLVLLSQNQLIEYRSVWKTELHRVILLPPTISAVRRQPECRVNGTRQNIRAQLGLGPDQWVWIAIGVQPKTKGLDRIIQALPYFPDARLLVVGIHDTRKAAAKLADRAHKLGVSSRITWLGHREDVPALMSAADLMLHPARYDTTGTVILEAIINGVPVIASSTCGYSRHVEAANAGIVIREPFDIQLFVEAIAEARDTARCANWSASGVAYGRNSDLYQGRSRAAEIILNAAKERVAGKPQHERPGRQPPATPTRNVVQITMPGIKRSRE